MNPHARPSTSLLCFAGTVWRQRELVSQMARREIVGRYQGSILGLAWSFFHPVLLLAVYTFVFSVVFRARWGGGGQSNVEYAIVMFVGLIVHGLFAEVANRSPTLVLANANYVKKVVFPLETLPVIALLGALFHAGVSVLVLLVAVALSTGQLYATLVLLPVILMPFAILTLGVSFLLSSLGVFVRDVGQTVGILTMLLMFLAPVVYPVSAVPEGVRPWLMANPLTFIIEQSRAVLVWGQAPDWTGLALYLVVSLLVAWSGFAWFQKTRKGFADVL